MRAKPGSTATNRPSLPGLRPQRNPSLPGPRWAPVAALGLLLTGECVRTGRRVAVIEIDPANPHIEPARRAGGRPDLLNSPPIPSELSQPDSPITLLLKTSGVSTVGVRAADAIMKPDS
jgi:hypothetical protein